MSNGKQFGYPQGEPFAPFAHRDCWLTCSECGDAFVGEQWRSTCTHCAVQKISDAVMAMREPMQKMGDGI